MDGLDLSIAAILTLDGVTNGVIYGLIAIALVLVFSVTRILFLPQGEFVAFGALTLATLQLGKIPGPTWLLLLLAACACATELRALLRSGQSGGIAGCVLRNLLIPCAVAGLICWAAPQQFPLPVQIALTLLLVTAIGPFLYQVVYESLADSSVLVLFIVSIGVHLALTGLGLVFFGAEGFRTPSLWDANWSFGSIALSGQAVVIMLAAATLGIALWAFLNAPCMARRARNRRQPAGCASDGDLYHARGQTQFCRSGLHRRLVRRADRADNHGLLRLRFFDRIKGLCRRHHWRSSEFSACGSGRVVCRLAGILRFVLGQRL